MSKIIRPFWHLVVEMLTALIVAHIKNLHKKIVIKKRKGCTFQFLRWHKKRCQSRMASPPVCVKGIPPCRRSPATPPGTTGSVSSNSSTCFMVSPASPTLTFFGLPGRGAEGSRKVVVYILDLSYTYKYISNCKFFLFSEKLLKIKLDALPKKRNRCVEVRPLGALQNPWVPSDCRRWADWRLRCWGRARLKRDRRGSYQPPPPTTTFLPRLSVKSLTPPPSSSPPFFSLTSHPQPLPKTHLTQHFFGSNREYTPTIFSPPTFFALILP